MKIRKKIIDTLVYMSTGFTVVHGLLFLMIVANRNLYATLSYHYSDNITWYVLIFGLPLISGITFYFWIKKRNIYKGIKILFGVIFILQLAFTIIATTMNLKYWGYAFKRPATFEELSSATKILQCSSITNYDSTGLKPFYIVNDTSENFKNLSGRKDPYYGNVDRAFMVFQDNSHRYADLYDFPNVYFDTARNVPSNELIRIDNQIQKTGIIDKGVPNYKHYIGLSGVVMKFQTADNEMYTFVGLGGGEVSNDHYPFYEFLFLEENGNYNLIKRQKYYTDFAGFEGIEYAYIALIFSLLLTITGVVILIVILIINRIMKKLRMRTSAEQTITYKSI